jgi:hypothetical protein
MEIVRTAGLDSSEEMLSRLRARVQFLESEKGSHHLVFLVKNLNP